MVLINRGSIPRLDAQGVKAFINTQYLASKKSYYDRMYNKMTSDKAYEEIVEYSNPGFALEGSEGSPTPYAGVEQLFTTRITPFIIKLGMMITHEAKADNLYRDVYDMAGSIASAFRETKELKAALLFDRAFNSSYVYGDGKELCATDHPSSYGTYSNELATPARLSTAALEDLLIQMATAKRNNGQQAMVQAKALLIHPKNMFQVKRILETDLQPGTANNDTNALRVWLGAQGGVEIIVNPYLQSEQPYFILTKTPANEGLIHLQREPFYTGMDNSGDARVEKVFGYERYTFSHTNPRAAYGVNAV